MTSKSGGPSPTPSLSDTQTRTLHFLHHPYPPNPPHNLQPPLLGKPEGLRNFRKLRNPKRPPPPPPIGPTHPQLVPPGRPPAGSLNPSHRCPPRAQAYTRHASPPIPFATNFANSGSTQSPTPSRFSGLSRAAFGMGSVG